MQLNGSSIIQAGQQLSSPIQIQLRHESLEDRHKTVAASSNDVKPLLPSVGQSSAVHSADASSIQKVTPPLRSLSLWCHFLSSSWHCSFYC